MNFLIKVMIKISRPPKNHTDLPSGQRIKEQFHHGLHYLPKEHKILNLCLQGNLACLFLLSADFFRKILSGIHSEYKIVWIQIRPDVLLGLIRIQTVSAEDKKSMKISQHAKSQCPIISGINAYSNNCVYHNYQLPSCVAQSVMCLAADMCLTTDPEVASLIPVWSHTFMEIVNEIISTTILLLSSDSRMVVVSYKPKYVHKVLLSQACPGNSVVR